MFSDRLSNKISSLYERHPRCAYHDSLRAAPSERAPLSPDDRHLVQAAHRVLKPTAISSVLMQLLLDDADGNPFNFADYLPSLQAVQHEPVIFETQADYQKLINSFDKEINDQTMIPRTLIKKALAIMLGKIELRKQMVLSDAHILELQDKASRILTKTGFDLSTLQDDHVLETLPGLSEEEEHQVAKVLAKDYGFTPARSALAYIKGSEVFCSQGGKSFNASEYDSLLKDFGYGSHREFVDHIKGKLVVDWGCGKFALARYSKLHKIPTTIININPALAYPNYSDFAEIKNPIQSSTRTKIKNHAAYFDHMPEIEDNSCDLVFASQSFPLYAGSIHKTKAGLKELMRILKPGGQAKILRVENFPRDSINHIFMTNKDKFVRRARKAGFKVKTEEIRSVMGIAEYRVVLTKPAKASKKSLKGAVS